MPSIVSEHISYGDQLQTSLHCPIVVIGNIPLQLLNSRLWIISWLNILATQYVCHHTIKYDNQVVHQHRHNLPCDLIEVRIRVAPELDPPIPKRMLKQYRAVGAIWRNPFPCFLHAVPD